MASSMSKGLSKKLLKNAGAEVGNKYSAVKVDERAHGGTLYDSGLEREVGAQLEWREQAGEICDIRHHVKVSLFEGTPSEIRYTADFRYTYVETGEHIYVEVKSPATDKAPRWRLIKKLWRTFGPAPLEVYMGRKGNRRREADVRLTETIFPVKGEA